MSTHPAAVECLGVSKSFGPVQALHATDLTLATGTLTAVLGPSGCGKTTLLLGPIGFETLATRVWSATQAGAFGDAALPALLLVAVGVLPTWALTRRGRTTVS